VKLGPFMLGTAVISLAFAIYFAWIGNDRGLTYFLFLELWALTVAYFDARLDSLEEMLS